VHDFRSRLRFILSQPMIGRSRTILQGSRTALSTALLHLYSTNAHESHTFFCIAQLLETMTSEQAVKPTKMEQPTPNLREQYNHCVALVTEYKYYEALPLIKQVVADLEARTEGWVGSFACFH
jgi:hypothetical protein